MKRRDFIALAGAATSFPRIAFAQQTARVPRVAFVWDLPMLPEWIAAFQQGLLDYGYVDGKTMTTETFVAPTLDDVPATVAKAVASKPDIIVTMGSVTALSAKSLGTTIPIVNATSDPVAQGLAASLAHPGGNITGVGFQSPEIASKTLGIMKEIIPTIKRIVALNEPANPSNPLAMEQVRAAAKVLGIDPVIVDFVDGPNFTAQFDQVVAAAPQAIYVPSSGYFSANRDLLADLQIKYRLPLFWPSPATNPRAMVGYGATTVVEIRRTGAYVDAILKGAQPSSLPIHMATVLDLSINLATAKAIGITIPPSIFAQATVVVEK